MQLSEKQVNQFKREGYTAEPCFFSEREVLALQTEVDRFKEERIVRNVATEGDGLTPSTSKSNLQLIPLHDKSDLLRSLPFEDRVTHAITQLIGAPAILHLDQMFLKPGEQGAGTAWHQDNAYFRISDPLFGTAMWVAIHDATIANGTIHVVPGSHLENYAHERDLNSDHHIRCEVPEHRAVPIELPAGGVAFFCYGTAHCTKANSTPHERAGMAFHFLHRDYLKEASMANDKPQITGSGASFGKNEYGTSLMGTWPIEVERVLSSKL